ncbi:hypothetical protein [Pedobacter glucosidilyticus]|uniref:hypothetical protein n=1 Tax=Pedobacter glucosidilyticus TaxID=1122941 RepID=UPI0026E94FCF|nr:hypothetical protein [Pedobacter glucosidilyticus]
MKKLLIIAFSLLATGLFAQSINPKQYAVIKGDLLRGKPINYIPYVNNDNMLFTPNGDYLFLVNAQEKEEGRLIVYSLKLKSEVKVFKIKKTGLYSFYGKVVCNPENTNQLAVVLSKGEVRVINNWQTAPEDVLLQKPGEHSVAINAYVEMGQIAFSRDGKSLFFIENKTKALIDENEVVKSADLSTGKITVKKLPDGKSPYIAYHVSTFIGLDEIIVFNKPTKTQPGNIEIYDLTANKFVRKFECASGFKSSMGSPRIISCNYEGYQLNLQTGEKDETIKRIKKSLEGEDTSLDIHYAPGKGYVVAYLYYWERRKETATTITTSTKTKTGLFFFDLDGNNVMGNFPALNATIPNTGVRNYQISPNGKYIIFNHDDKDSSNERLVIATL